MAFAASRYTEARLDPFCAELFRGIDKNAVDFVDNYDSTMKEPTLLPTTFPNILVSPNVGIAVGMASSICSFNLAEVCDAAIAVLRNPKTSVDRLLDILKAPDFAGGATIIYNREQMRKIYETGRGSFKMRARYAYDKANNCIDILQIPYSTSIELIMKRLTELIKEGKLKEVTDVRDEIDISGFRLTIDLRRGTDVEKLMAKLYKMTPLEDDFSCNFNVLIDGTPRQLGVDGILREWIRFRINCYRRELTFDLGKKQDKLHLLLGLAKILLDIDKAIKIVRETEKEEDVVPNLEAGFGIDKVQAEYIAEIKLRNLNREYILNRVREIEKLQEEIAHLKELIEDEIKLKGEIAHQLTEIKKKYGIPRKTQILAEDDVVTIEPDSMIENYNVKILMTKEGYFKKITLQSLRGNDEQKLKENDEILFQEDAENKDDIIFFTNKAQVYRAKISDFEDTKASALGEFVPAKLGFEEGERPILAKRMLEYRADHNIIFVFENGKAVRIPLTAYETKGNRRRLTGAFSAASPVVAAFYEESPMDVLLVSNASKAILVNSSLIPLKTTRTSAGNILFSLKKGQKVEEALIDFEGKYENPSRYRKHKLPSSGIVLSERDIEMNQLKI